MSDTLPSDQGFTFRVQRTMPARIVASVEVESAKHTEAEANAIRKIAGRMNVPGFRPGKAPEDVVRARVTQEDLTEETVRALLPLIIDSIMKQEKMKPVLHPAISITKAEPLSLDVVFVEEPTASVKGLKKKTFEKKPHKVDAKDVNRVIDQFLKDAHVEKKAERAAKEGDVVIADFWAEDKAGKEIDGARATDYRIDIGSKTLIAGFEDGMKGVKAGESRDLKLTFPENYHSEELKGKPVTFHVTTKDVLEVTRPELTRELLKEKTGQDKDPAEFRADIEKSLIEQEETMEHRRREQAFFEAVAEATSVQIPGELIDAEMQATLSHMEEQLKASKATIEEWLTWQKKNVEDFLKETRDTAEKRLKIRSGIAALFAEHGIAATKEEIDAHHRSLHAHDEGAAHGHDHGHDDDALAWEVKVKKLLDQYLSE